MSETLKVYKPTPKFNSSFNIIKEIAFGAVLLLALGYVFRLDIWFSIAQLGITIFAIFARKEIMKGKERKHIVIDLDKKLVIIDEHKTPFHKIKDTEIQGKIIEVSDYDGRVIEAVTPDAKKFYEDLSKILSKEQYLE
jgi:hypothetical protein